MTEDEVDYFYGLGWTFYKSRGVVDSRDDREFCYTSDQAQAKLKVWLLGFLAAMADYPDIDNETLTKSLLFCNVDNRVVDYLVYLAKQAISESTEFIRLPPRHFVV